MTIEKSFVEFDDAIIFLEGELGDAELAGEFTKMEGTIRFVNNQWQVMITYE